MARKMTKWMLLGLGTGAAAAAYLTYPEQGRKRRAALAVGARKFVDRVASSAKKSLVDSQHRLAGLAAKVRNSFTAQTPSDRVLEGRIRSRMGRVVSHPRRIHVVCDRGVAILWGVALEEEIFRLLEVVGKIPGVVEVVDHLDIATPDELPPGSPHPLKEARDNIRLNWSPSKRLAVAAAGTLLVVKGWRRNDKLGNVLAVVGSGMIVRSTMRNHLRATWALTDSSPGFEVNKTIRINAPISDLFDFWANPENYPKAFSHVARIDRLGENLYRWTLVGPAGIPVGWEGVITRTVPNTLVEWKSLPGSAIKNFGVVHFDPIYDASTRVNVRMFYRPPAGILGKFFAELFGADAEHVLDQDLKRLKYLFEKRAVGEEDELLRTATT